MAETPMSAITLSVASVLAESAARRPRAIAVTDGTTAVTYAALWRDALRIAALLRGRGVSPGDRVAMRIPNTLDFPRVYYGILAAGGVVVPIHPLSVAREVAEVVERSEARLIFDDPSLGDAAGVTDRVARIGTTSLDDLLSDVEPLLGLVPTGPLDPAAMLFTSGTSGRSKGALLSHLGLVEQTHVALIDSIDVRGDDVLVAALPLSHIFAQSNILNTAFRRGATVLLVRRFVPEETLDLMTRQGATVLAAVPTMLIGLLEAARTGAPLPALRYVLSGGAALPTAILRSFTDAFGAPIHEGYGLTETSPTATINHLDDVVTPGTAGTPVWGMEVRIASETNRERIELLADEEIGEIVIRGHGVFLGYHANPEATAEAVVDGWFRTGDLGTRSADGRLRVVDRVKDLIIRGGYNIYPREIEETLARMPGILTVACYGVPDARLGQEVAIAVVADENVSLTDDEVLEYARTQIAAHKRPRTVRFLKSLPLGPTGKVLRRQLAEEFRPEADRSTN